MATVTVAIFLHQNSAFDLLTMIVFEEGAELGYPDCAPTLGLNAPIAQMDRAAVS